MPFISDFLEDYKNHCLNQQGAYDEIEAESVKTLRIPHVPGSDVMVLATSWSDIVGGTESCIVHTVNLKSVNEFSYDPGENYTINTHMYVKIDKNKPAGVLVSGCNGETEDCFTLFTA